MNERNSAIAYHAVLIGINTYKDKPLKGCVRDVRAIRDHLKRWYSPVHIELLTASSLEDIPEPQEILPTYHHVMAALEKIRDRAKPRDHVYIHFSGHGSRFEPSSEYSNLVAGDLALNLLADNNSLDIRYLPGLELAYLLNSMVIKELLVTLILDCCFSGSVIRDDDASRFLPFDPDIVKKYPVDESRILNVERGLTLRDMTMRPSWIVNPDGYAILTACGPHEKAYEIKFGSGGEKNGALSYLLLQILSRNGYRRIRHQDLFAHLCAIFREKKAPQAPMFYGNSNRFLFTNATATVRENYLLPITKVKSGSIILPAGEAHGISIGDEFELHEFYQSSQKLDALSELIARAVDVRPLTSKLEIFSDFISSNVQTGWIAIAINKRPMRFSSSESAKNLSCHEDILNIRTWSYPDVSEVGRDSGSQTSSFHVSRNMQKGYDIFNTRTRQTIHIPLRENQDDNAFFLSEVLEHLERLEIARNLAPKNPDAFFDSSFSVQLVDATGERFNANDSVKVNSGNVFKIEVKNKSSLDLYLYMYYIGPYYQFENAIKGVYEVIPPRNTDAGFPGMTCRSLRAKLPSEFESIGQNHCQDTIKVILTSQPTSFEPLELPKILDLQTGSSATASEVLKVPRTGGKGYSMGLTENWCARTFSVVITNCL